LAARSKIETMAMIHTQLYRKDQSAHVDLVKHIQHLYHNLLSLFGMGRQIDFRLQAAGIHLPVEKAVPCALILNELLSNALKHAFKCRGSGQIHVVCELKASGILQITVRDNGIGMPRELDLDTTKSLGLKLVRILTKEQLAGEVLTNNDGGAVVTIRFQISPRMKAMSKAIHRRVSYPEKHQ
jgi:two-component sensor histidine kinase